jgi:hypothetical protein
MKRRVIAVGSLKGVSVVFRNDLYRLASFLLKAFDAKNRGTNRQSRPTLHGLACAYVNLIHELRVDDIKEKLKQQGFDLGATVEWDAE